MEPMNRRPEDLETRHLEEAFSGGDWEPPGEECPGSGELWASAAGELEPEADRRIILHLADCGGCSSAWRLAREMMETGERVPAAPTGRKRPAGGWRSPAALAAAATVLIGLGLGTGLLLERREPMSPPVYRQQAVEAGLEAAPETGRMPRDTVVLRWYGAPGGSRYDLTVTDTDLNVLLTVRDLRTPEHRVEPEVIPPGTEEILWRVTARLPDGGTVASRTFVSRLVD